MLHDVAGHLDQLHVAVLGEPLEDAERLVCGDAVPLHQHALGLSDDRAPIYCPREVVTGDGPGLLVDTVLDVKILTHPAREGAQADLI